MSFAAKRQADIQESAKVMVSDLCVPSDVFAHYLGEMLFLEKNDLWLSYIHNYEIIVDLDY